MFNRESERRGEIFITRKITRAAALIKLGLKQKLYLGNLAVKRDGGRAEDFVEAMWLMLQRPESNDFVIATGEAYSVRDFAERVFSKLNLDTDQYIKQECLQLHEHRASSHYSDCFSRKPGQQGIFDALGGPLPSLLPAQSLHSLTLETDKVKGTDAKGNVSEFSDES